MESVNHTLTPTAPMHRPAVRSRPEGQVAAARRLAARWAANADDVQAAQRLRYQVFADEWGAQLRVPPGTPPGLDVDRFDAHCEHLIIEAWTDDTPPTVVGTYRVLTPGGARLAGGLYSETEFDLAPLARLLPMTAELGRSCVARPWRQGGVILMLWSSLADFMARNGLQAMLGCASVPMLDGGHVAASLWRRLQAAHLAPATQQLRARLPLPVDALDAERAIEIPLLIRGYLRCGARVLGAPAWDPAFGVANFPMLLEHSQLPPAYRERFAWR